MAGAALRGLGIDRARFRDGAGRSVLLRGVNLGGDCKAPAMPDGRTFIPTTFEDHRTVNFIGRPFALSEASAHFRRLARWGFNCIRMLTTWEAVQHEGPGLRDEAYLDYFREVCRIAGEFGFHVFIDFHQDVWSRMTGGSGAPGWTLDAAGIDFRRLDAADGAHVMQYRYDPRIGGIQESYPAMSWASNYQAPANGLMWTLFWGGDVFAPNHRFEGRNLKDALQDNFLDAMRAVAERVCDLPQVIGFDTLNEPGRGWIGRGLEQRAVKSRGLRWNVLDALAAASGLSRTIPVDGARSGDSCRIVNEARVPIWRDGVDDPFRAAGVWDIAPSGEAVALKPDHFVTIAGKPALLEADFILPFFHRVAETIRSVRSDWLVFAEISPHAVAGYTEYPGALPERSVNALHWYDYTALVNKAFSTERTIDILTNEVREGRDATKNYYVDQLSHIRAFGDKLPGGAPTLIGEFGIPFDLDEGASFRRWAAGERGDQVWQAQAEALGLMYDAMDELLISSTLWNYTASNRNDPMIGDGWNQEDLSIFSLDQVDDPDDPDAGARALKGFCRPYVRAAQGELIRQRYEATARRFEFEIKPDPAISAPTEIFVPVRFFGAHPVISCDGARVDWDGMRQTFAILSADRALLTGVILPSPSEKVADGDAGAPSSVEPRAAIRTRVQAG